MNSSDRTPINHCQIPPWLLADVAFQESPLMIAIGDVLTSEGRLWRKLQVIEDAEERGWAFHDYLCERFKLNGDNPPGPAREDAPGHGYLHAIRAWGTEQDGPAGASLKAWVESRFGLRTLYHGGTLATDGEARRRYVHDRVVGAARTFGLFQQLDLFYTFAQAELQRRQPQTRWLTLYRSFDQPEDGEATRTRDGRYHVELNNLTTFYAEQELGWSFGVAGWEVRVPVTKVLYFPGLLPAEFLRDMRDHLVLGGQYLMRKATI